MTFGFYTKARHPVQAPGPRFAEKPGKPAHAAAYTRFSAAADRIPAGCHETTNPGDFRRVHAWVIMLRG